MGQSHGVMIWVARGLPCNVYDPMAIAVNHKLWQHFASGKRVLT